MNHNHVFPSERFVCLLTACPVNAWSQRFQKMRLTVDKISPKIWLPVEVDKNFECKHVLRGFDGGHFDFFVEFLHRDWANDLTSVVSGELQGNDFLDSHLASGNRVRSVGFYEFHNLLEFVAVASGLAQPVRLFFKQNVNGFRV